MDKTSSDPWLLTPGPLTTSKVTREAMMRDMGSRDEDFMQINTRIIERLVDLAGGRGTHACVLLQGSGSFAVEATLGTMVPRDGKVLILVNGAYGRRMAKMCQVMGRSYEVLEGPEDQPSDVAALAAHLRGDPSITHVAAVFCETTSGILNPIEDIAQVVAASRRALLVDAMSGFGALALNVAGLPCQAVMASSNKCLEGVPGAGFVIAEEKALEAASGNSHSLCLDLADQWRFAKASKQWRFTPPIHVLAALDAALEQHGNEGGIQGRAKRYRANCKVLVEGMRGLGFETLLSDELQAPIIVTFHIPDDPNFYFEVFYHKLKDRNFVIYPGKLTQKESFRIGCIGQVDTAVMDSLITAIGEILEEMQVTNRAGKEI